MITITKNIKITGPTDSEYLDYQLYSTSNCISITPSSNRITGNSATILFTFKFTDESCFNNTIYLKVTNDEGCTTTNSFKLSNPCTVFAAEIVNINDGGNPFTFNVTLTNGQQPFVTEWDFDRSLFNSIVDGVNGLKLEIIDGVSLPGATNIIANVTDSYGCFKQAIYAYQFNSPIAQPENIIIFCNPSSKKLAAGSTCSYFVGGQSFKTQLRANTLDGTTIDWDSLVITNNNSDLCYLNHGDGLITIYSKTGTTTANKTITWSVANNLGIRSNTETLYISVTTCSNTGKIAIFDRSIILDPSARDEDDETLVDILDSIVVSEGRSINWDSFTFVELTGQTLVDPTHITTENGAAELTTGRQIKFTVGATTDFPVEVIAYTIEDDLGNLSNTGRIYLDFEASAAPAVSNQTRSVATGSSRNINLLTGATGNPLPNNILITQAPTNGVYTLGVDGTLTYSPTITVEGSDTIKYKVYNAENVASAEITLTLTIVHAGVSTTIQHCRESTALKLLTALGSGVTSGGVWAEAGTNPTTGITLTSPDAVSLSGASEGYYRFTYTVTSDTVVTTKSVTVNYLAYAATHLSTTGGGSVTPGTVPLTSRFQLNPENIPYSNVRFQIHNGSAPLTPDSSNIVNELSATASESVTGIFELKLTDAAGTSLPAAAGVYEVRLKVSTPCGEVFYVNSGVEIDGNDS